MLKIETIIGCGYSEIEASDILTRTGLPENLQEGKCVVRRFDGLKEEGGKIISAGEHYYESSRRKNR